MFCPKCGSQLEESQKTCNQCNFDLAMVEQEPSNTSVGVIKNIAVHKASSESAKANINVIKLISFSIIAVVILIMFFNAASSIAKGGLGIMDIQSVGGKTLDEAYYRELGSIYAGYANVVRALGVFCASVLVSLGLKK